MNKEMNQEEKVHRSRKKTVYRLSGEIRQYKKDALLSPLFTIFCVILEILIPYPVSYTHLDVYKRQMHDSGVDVPPFLLT